MDHYVTCRTAVILSVCCLLDTASAKAATAKPTTPATHKTTIAVFPVMVAGTPKKEVVDAIEPLLDRLLVHGETDFLRGAALDAKLGAPARAALERCKENPDCIAQLGKNVGAASVIYPMASQQAGAVRLDFFAIDVKTPKLERRATIQAATATGLESEVRDAAPTIFGVNAATTATLAPEAAPAPAGKSPAANAADLDLELPSLVSVGGGGDDLDLAPIAPIPGGATPKSPGAGKNAGTGKSPTPGGKTTVIHAAPASAGAMASKASSSDTTPVLPPRPHPLLLAGAGTGALGALLAGTGGLFGLKSISAKNELQARDANGRYKASLKRATQLKSDCYDNADRANLFYVLGAVAAAAGAGLAAYDLFVVDRLRVQISAGPESRTASMIWQW
jgi:hypothetical protein